MNEATRSNLTRTTTKRIWRWQQYPEDSDHQNRTMMRSNFSPNISRWCGQYHSHHCLEKNIVEAKMKRRCLYRQPLHGRRKVVVSFSVKWVGSFFWRFHNRPISDNNKTALLRFFRFGCCQHRIDPWFDLFRFENKKEEGVRACAQTRAASVNSWQQMTSKKIWIDIFFVQSSLPHSTYQTRDILVGSRTYSVRHSHQNSTATLITKGQ